MNNEITLKLKKYGSYELTSMGVFLYLEHDFRVFVPNVILDSIFDKKRLKKQLKNI